MKGKPICLLMSYQKVKFPCLPSLEKALMTSILKRVGIERPYFMKENAFYAKAVGEEKHFVMECDSLST